MTARLAYSAAAKSDLAGIYDWVADRADPHTAFAYTGRIEARCESLTYFPRRGTPRDDLLAGLRTIPFERQATIAYLIEEGTVRIVRIFHRGRDAAAAFERL